MSFLSGATCRSCKNEAIDFHRNKSRLCRKCGKNSKRKFRQEEPFTFAIGADRAINGNSTNQAEKTRSFHSAHSIACQPWEISFRLNDKNDDVLTVCSLISNSLAPKVAKLLYFEKGSNKSLEYPVTVRFTATQPVDQILSNQTNEYTYIPPLTTSICASAYPKVINVLGPYTEMDDEIAALLNMDFRLFASKLEAVPYLFTGSILQGDETVLVLTNEVYGRNCGIDVHAEKDNETRPYGQEKYRNITCGLYKKADSPNSSTKLMIGSKSLNILITASTTISTSPIHSVGPSTNITLSAISSKSSKIYLRSISIKKFKEAFNQLTSTSTTTSNNISKLRQVTSSLQDKSTYDMLRATLEPFDDDLYQPVTIFTLCDLPNNEGYGCSDKSYMKLISKFLQITATKEITNNTKFEMTDFDDVFTKFEFISSQKKKLETKDDSSASKILRSLMEACQSYKENNGKQADVMEFARSYSLSSLATTASSAVSKGNEKIAENISMLLSRLFN